MIETGLASSELSPTSLCSSQSGSCVWTGPRCWRSAPCSRRSRSWRPGNREDDFERWLSGYLENNCTCKRTHLRALFGALVEEVEGARPLHPEQNTRKVPLSAASCDLKVQLGVRGVPGVARLLRSTALQLLHQHLAAPPQSVADLPEGAAAAEGPVALL